MDEFEGDETSCAVVDAAQTPPFLTDRRIVVARDVGRFSADQLARSSADVADLLPTTELVLSAAADVWGNRCPTPSRRPAGERTTTPPHGPGTGRAGSPTRRRRWGPTRRRPLRSSPSGSARTSGGSTGWSATLAATFGGGRALGPEDVEPFLGEGGGVPPWELTDAIDAGDTAGALGCWPDAAPAGGTHCR